MLSQFLLDGFRPAVSILSAFLDFSTHSFQFLGIISVFFPLSLYFVLSLSFLSLPLIQKIGTKGSSQKNMGLIFHNLTPHIRIFCFFLFSFPVNISFAETCRNQWYAGLKFSVCKRSELGRVGASLDAAQWFCGGLGSIFPGHVRIHKNNR